MIEKMAVCTAYCSVEAVELDGVAAVSVAVDGGRECGHGDGRIG